MHVILILEMRGGKKVRTERRDSFCLCRMHRGHSGKKGTMYGSGRRSGGRNVKYGEKKLSMLVSWILATEEERQKRID